MFNTFAHAGEVHDAVRSIVPWYSKWYLLLLTFIVCISIITYLTYRISKKSLHTTYNVLLAILLVSGMFGYRYSSLVSVLSLSIGFAMALAQVLFGLGYKRDNGNQGTVSEQ